MRDLMDGKNNLIDNEDSDLSESYYNLLLTELDKLSNKIQDEINNNMVKQRENQLFRYNQSLITSIPKHILVKANYKVSNFSANINIDQKYQIIDMEKNKNFTYITQSNVTLTSLNVRSAEKEMGKYLIKLAPQKPVSFDGVVFDLWINPELWDQFNYKLAFLKRHLLMTPNIRMNIIYTNGSIEHCNARVENINNVLPLNDNVKLRLFSPEFDLGLKIIAESTTHQSQSSIQNIELEFELKHFIKSGLLDLSIPKDKLFTTNIIPIFNLFDDYSISQKLDEKYDEIPLLHPTNSDAKPLSVLQVWLNSNIYEQYYNHTASEFFFHKLTQKLFYYPKDIAESITKRKKVFAKVLWTENSDHGSFLDVKSSAFVTSSKIRYDIVCYKKDIDIMQPSSLEQVIQIFRTFSDLDIREYDSVFVALRFLCEEKHLSLYKKFRKEVDTINYNSKENTLNFFVKNKRSVYFVEYVTEIISDFFYINSPQMIKVNVFTK